MQPGKRQTNPQRLNYDNIAPEYNRRFEAKENPGMEAALQKLVKQTHAERILEVGCGTAHWLEKLSAVGNIDVTHCRALTGLDFSFGMLSQARRETHFFSLVHGQAEQLPFQAAAFDLVYCVNAIHHFSNPAAFVHETQRVLQPKGTIAILGNNPHSPNTRWYAYDFFEGIYKRDLKRFPTKEMLESWLQSAGFVNLQWDVAEHIHAPWIGEEVFQDPFLQKNATSQLASLSDAAYQKGIRRIQAAIEKAEKDGEEIIFHTELDIYILTAMLSPEKHV